MTVTAWCPTVGRLPYALEDTYPDRPSLFGGATGRAHARFINAWADGVMLGAIARLIVRDLLDVVAPQDRGYFRESREARFGMSPVCLLPDGGEA